MEGGTGWITNTTRAADEMMKMKQRNSFGMLTYQWM